ncbi:MAG: DUF1302 family protein [Pseudohongiellaceae bacterium]
MVTQSVKHSAALWLVFCPLLLLTAVGLRAQNTATGDFFGTLDIDIDTATTEAGDVSVLGWITEKFAYGIEEPPPFFSRSEREPVKLETSLFAQLDWRLGENTGLRLSAKAWYDAIYQLNDDTPYTRAERNRFGDRAEIRDFYLERDFGNGFYTRVGNQIVSWGMSEYLRITDLVNTEDQFTFGQQDLEDIRLPVPALLTTLSRGEWVYDAVVTTHAGRNDTAPAGDEFDQFPYLVGRQVERPAPENQLEYFLRASTHYSRGDIALVVADFNDNGLSGMGLSSQAGSGTGNPVFTLKQERTQAAGISANRVDGPWLVFGEAGLHFNRPVLPATPELLQLAPWTEKDQLLAALGIEYNGFRNLIITLEADSVYTRDHDETVQAQKQESSFGARLYWTSLNERLQTLAVWNRLGENRGYITRLSLDYEWSDTLGLGLMWVDYHGDRDSVLYNYRNNDMVQLQMRYSFQRP